MVVQAIGELVETNPTAQLSRAFLTMTPNDTMDEFWLPLRSFDYSAAGKNGCPGYDQKKTSKVWNGFNWLNQLFILVRCQFLSFNFVTLQFFHPTRSWPFTFQSFCRMGARVASATLSASFHCEALRERLAISRWESLMVFAKSS